MNKSMIPTYIVVNAENDEVVAEGLNINELKDAFSLYAYKA